MDTNDYLNLIKERNGWSDYRIAKELGISRGTVSNYRIKEQHFRDDIAIKVAELLGFRRQKVLADIHAARSKDPSVKKVWERIAASAAMLLVSLNIMAYTPEASANSISPTVLPFIDYAQ